MRDHEPIAIGARLGPYEILGPIGRGGMGEVYRARDARLGREVAVKVLPADAGHIPDRLPRFEREAQAVAALNHPNILALHDIGNEAGVVYAVMELLEGDTLRVRLEQPGGSRRSRRSTTRFRSRAGWPPRTSAASCTGISSPRTSSSRAMDE